MKLRAIFSAYLVLVTALFFSPPAALLAAKPNILHIHADDHRADGLHALGNRILQTPNLDSLVERGMTFTHCYTMGSMIGAVCTPSRTMMLTGRSWQRIPGARDATPNAQDPMSYMPRVLDSAGYQTWHMGKYGNGFPAGLKEFQTTINDDAKGEDPTTDRAHCSQRLADSTIQFLRSRADTRNEKPFYIYIAPPVPHDPRSAEPQFHKLYDPAKIPLSPAFMPQHPFDNGEMTVRDEALAPWPRTPEDTKQQIADYYACVTGLDHHIGRIFAELKASEQWENTIIIFSGDNGLSLGEHGLFGKQNLYEFGGMHVPLILAGPGIAKGKSEALVYLMDLFTTFADFAGAKVPAGVEGISLRPIVEGKQTKVRDVLYTGYRNCQRAIRDERWKLIRYPLVDRTQLFDLSADPHELINLVDNPEHQAKVLELTQLLKKEMAAHADNFPLTVSNPKSGEWSPPASSPGSKKPAKTPDGQDAVPDTANDITPSRSVTYKSVDGIELKLDVFEPMGLKPTDHRPAIVFFFGGGWSSGDKKQFYQQAKAMTEQGLIAMSADYRVKSRNNTTPFECVKDGKSAIRWVREHAVELGVDPDRIVASGGSAGGHVAACTGVIDGAEEAGEKTSVSSVPNAMILFNPVLDTTAKGFGGKSFKPEQQSDISPCHHVRKGIVPTIVFHGTADKTVPFENAERFTRLMKDAGNECMLVPFEGREHGFFNGSLFRKSNSDADFDLTMKRSIEFLTSHGLFPAK